MRLLVAGDATALLLFASVGRMNHGETFDVAGLLWTAAPFLAGGCPSNNVNINYIIFICVIKVVRRWRLVLQALPVDVMLLLLPMSCVDAAVVSGRQII